MNVEVEIDIRGLTKELQNLIKGMKDFKAPMKKSSEILLREQQENFDKQGVIYQGGGFVRAGGAFSNQGSATTRSRAWEPLKESTKQQRKALGYGGARPILVRTGKLKRGFRVTRLTAKELTIKNLEKHGIFHQNGTKKMPQRRIMGFSNKSTAAIRLEFLNHIKKYLKNFK
jgi:phage gpG-like protein